MIVYQVTNKINGKKYIGFTTKTLSERIKTHVRKSKYEFSNQYFYPFACAIRKYGIEAFEYSILKQCESIEECKIEEKNSIKQFNTISPSGYNLSEGGNGGQNSTYVNDKISQTLKKYYKDNGHVWENIDSETRSMWAKKAWDTKKLNGVRTKGAVHTAASREKISITKNTKNKIGWININTGEKISLSMTDMSKYTGLSISTFNHLKHGRQSVTKCGWMLNFS